MVDVDRVRIGLKNVNSRPLLLASACFQFSTYTKSNDDEDGGSRVGLKI